MVALCLRKPTKIKLDTVIRCNFCNKDDTKFTQINKYIVKAITWAYTSNEVNRAFNFYLKKIESRL